MKKLDNLIRKTEKRLLSGEIKAKNYEETAGFLSGLIKAKDIMWADYKKNKKAPKTQVGNGGLDQSFADKIANPEPREPEEKQSESCDCERCDDVKKDLEAFVESEFFRLELVRICQDTSHIELESTLSYDQDAKGCIKQAERIWEYFPEYRGFDIWFNNLLVRA